MNRVFAATAALALLQLGTNTAAVVPDPKGGPYPVPRAASAVKIDGVVDDEAWTGAWTFDLTYEVRPGENAPAPVRTEVLLMHDDDNLYVAFRAHDPEPAAIRAHLSDRDSLGGDDWVGIVLDTFNDERRNFLLLVNPYGVQQDNMEVSGLEDVGWDGIWESAARRADWGWSAEIRVPFTSLAFQRTNGAQVWGFDAIRGYPRSIFRQMGAFPRDRNNNCYLCQAIKITGFEGIMPGKNLEIDPTLTATASEVRSDLPDGPLDEGERDADAGISARWGFTPNLALSAAVNPDFSQVEADALQLDVNEPFALFYDEKRPFFMEASDFLRLPLDVVYTRTIRDPSWGVKLTGKEGAHTIAAYAVKDEITNLLFPGPTSSSGTSLEGGTLDSVARYKLDIGNRTTLGLIATDREGDDYSNRLAGLDGDFRFSDTDRVRVLALGSRTRYPDAVAAEFEQPSGTFSDWAGEAVYSHDSRNVDYYVHLRHMGEGFRADQGLIAQVGYRGGEIGASYEWLPNGDSWYSNLELQGMVNTFDDADGETLLRQARVAFTYQGPLQSHAFIQLTRTREGYGGTLYTWDDVYLHNCMSPNASTSYFVNLRFGDRIDYANGRLGTRVRINPGMDQRFGIHLHVSLSATWEKMDVDEGRLFTAAVAQLAASYQFTAECFLRAVLQHIDYDYATELYSDGRDASHKRLFGQLLFSYKLDPRTVLFLGYTDNRLGKEDFEPVTAERAVFTKIGYAWTL